MRDVTKVLDWLEVRLFSGVLRRYWGATDLPPRVDHLVERAPTLRGTEEGTVSKAGAKQGRLALLSVVLIVAVLSSALLPASASAQTCGPTRGVRLWADVSGSLDPVEASRVLHLIGSAAAELDCLEWVAVHEFAELGDVFGAAAFYTRNVLPPSFTCSADGPRDFAKFLRREVEKYEQRCESERRGAQEPYLIARAAYRDALLSAVHSVDFTPVEEPDQTCLMQALARAAADGPEVLNVFVTDGAQHQCDVEPSDLLNLGSAGTARIIVVLVPSENHPDRFLAGVSGFQRAIEGSFPEAKLVASFVVQDVLDFLAILLLQR